MAKLPDVPKGLELEDFVAALFQCTQHYVERNICEPDVLELDVVATSFTDDHPHTRVVEVKSGKWGFGELFKTLGRMHYLSISRGLFITSHASDEQSIQFYADRVKSKGLEVLLIDEPPKAPEMFEQAGYGTVDKVMHHLWRYSFWTERRLIEALRADAKSRPEAVGPREVLKYFRLVNDEVFLTSDPRQRAVKLYEAFSTHPLLTLGVARELDAEEFDVETTGETPALRAALYEGKHPVLQASMYVEHRARLAVLKSVIDCLCAGYNLKSKGLLAGLPASFLDAAATLKHRPKFSRYALAWQLLLWGWGGVILDKYRDEETAALAAQAGLDQGELEDALGAFDLLFPTQNPWVRHMPTADYQFVAMVPWPFMGVGALHRLMSHSVTDLMTLKLEGQYTVSDLARRLLALSKLLG